MKKKVLSLLLVAAMGISMLVGCGGGSDTDAGANKGTENAGTNTEAEFKVNQEAIDTLVKNSEGKTVKLDLWCSETEAYQTVMKSIVEDFKKQYPDVTFEITIGAVSEADAKDRVTEDIAAAADVFVFADDQINDLVKAGALQKITNFYTYDVAKENVAGTVEATKVDGAQYAYPLTASNGYFLFYNTKHVSAEQAQSWEGLLEAAKAANSKVGFDMGNGWYLYSWFAGAGCNLSYDGTVNSCDWNSAKGLAVAKAVMDICSSDNFISIGNADATAMIASNPDSLVAFVDGTWDADKFAAAYADGYAAAKLPTFKVDGKDVQMGSYAGYKMVGVNAYSEEAGWSMLLAEYITNEANQIKIGTAVSEAPANIVASQNEAFQSNPALVALSAQSEFADRQVVGGNFWTPAGSLGAILVEGTDDLQKALDDAVAGITQP